MTEKIVSKPTNKKYRDGWDKAFGNPKFKCNECGWEGQDCESEYGSEFVRANYAIATVFNICPVCGSCV